MHPYSNTGWIEVIAGCMESGKTEELRRRVRRALIADKRIVVFTCASSEVSARPFDVRTRDGKSVSARPVVSAEEIEEAVSPGVEVVAIDEAHFLDTDLLRVAAQLAEDGCEVLCAGLDTDFRGRTFGPMGDLLAEAEVVDKLHAICTQCHGKATRTQRLVAGRPAPAESPVVQGLRRTHYEPRCRACHMVPAAD